MFFPLAMSHNLIVWSSLPEAKVLPSGLKAMQLTSLVWPARVARGFCSSARRGEVASVRNRQPTPTVRRCRADRLMLHLLGKEPSARVTGEWQAQPLEASSAEIECTPCTQTGAAARKTQASHTRPTAAAVAGCPKCGSCR